jgi:polyisoprenoid-binding protein YceI
MIRKSAAKLAVLAGLLFAVPQSVHADDYNIDPDHSKVTFKVKHLGISWVPGKFNEFSGSYSFDPAKIGESKASASIKSVTIDTDNEKRDNHLKGADFLDTDNFPAMSFESTKVTPNGKDKFAVEGNLKIRDVTKPVTLDVIYNGSAKGMQGEDRSAFTATTTIKRKDWGMGWNKLIEAGGLAVGEDVFVTIEIEGVKG